MNGPSESPLGFQCGIRSGLRLSPIGWASHTNNDSIDIDFQGNISKLGESANLWEEKGALEINQRKLTIIVFFLFK